MLKPRYDSMLESMSDFTRMLDGMNKVQPRELSFNNALDELYQREQIALAEAKELSKLAPTKLNESKIYQATNRVALMYKQLADQTGTLTEAAKKSFQSKVVAKLVEAQAYFSEQHKLFADKLAPAAALTESAKKPKPVNEFRRLAGLVEQEESPRNPGILGNTRHSLTVRAFDKSNPMPSVMLEAERETKAHDAKMKKDAEVIKKAADDVETAHEDDEDDKADKKDEAVKPTVESKWAAGAVKHPGRLHKYFGIAPDQKIPMAKIKAAYDKLKNKAKKTSEEESLMRAMALGIRFKGGDVPGGKKKKGLAGK